MRLRVDQIYAFVELTEPDLAPADRAERVARLQRPDALTDGMRVAVDAEGRVAGAVTVYVGGLEARLGAVRLGPGAPAGACAALIAEACATAAGRKITSRVPIGLLTTEYRAALERAGFVTTGERYEYRAPLAALPDDAGTPFTWRSAPEVGFGLAAQLLRDSARSSGQWDEADDPQEALRESLTDPVLTGGEHLAEVGYVDGEPVAVVVAQVNPTTGWSRITWMGLRPSHQGRGLGAWLHRRGFVSMRAQGGRTYVGGTGSQNQPMQRLFERHGCERIAHLVELERAAAP